jgi:GMP synthase-like glutamine amidotransferase
LKLAKFNEVRIKESKGKGICFGHQIVGRAMGAKVDRSDKGWEPVVQHINLVQRGPEIFGKTALVNLSI